jgi:hypothetical protein
MRESMFSDWLHDLKSKKGLCCSEADGNTLRDVDWSERERMQCRPTPIDEAAGDVDGHYCVRIEGVWWIVSDQALIEDPNKSGLAQHVRASQLHVRHSQRAFDE